MSTEVDTHPVRLEVNGDLVELAVPARWTLADFLRDRCGLTGTHLGCEQGVCGACTVLVDGDPVRSCLLFAVQCDGRSIRTVEGLAEGDELHPLQASLAAHHGLQCGFCTPGFLMLAIGILEREPDIDRDRLRAALAANLCRCTGYQQLVAAVEDYAVGQPSAER